MSRSGRIAGIVVIGALTLVTLAVGLAMIPTLVEATVWADAVFSPVGTEILTTSDKVERAAAFGFWGPAFLVSLGALAAVVLVVALRWPRTRSR